MREASGGREQGDEQTTAEAENLDPNGFENAQNGRGVSRAAQMPTEFLACEAAHSRSLCAKVPDFVGKTVKDVMQEAAAGGIQVDMLGDGLARTQEPTAGALLLPGEHIRVRFAR
jgi:hypothetical protein